MYDLGWISQRDAVLFNRTANSFSVLGIDARHGTDVGQPPADPMPLSKARALVVGLVDSWLQHLGAEPRDSAG